MIFSSLLSLNLLVAALSQLHFTRLTPKRFSAPKVLWLWLLIITSISAGAQEGLMNADKALSIFVNSTDRQVKTNMAFELGEIYWSTRRLPQAKQWYKKSLEFTPVATDSNNVVNALHLLANVYLNEATYDSALIFCEKSFASIRQISNRKLLPNLYQTRGRIYLQLGDHQAAILNCSVADSLYEISPYEEMRSQSPYTKILLGQVFQTLHRMDKAKEYFDKALQFSGGQKSMNTKASSLQTIAQWHVNMKEFAKAEKIYRQLLQPPLVKYSSYRMMYTYAGLGDVYLGLQMPDSGLRYYKLGMYESKLKGEQHQQDVFYCKMGDAYLQLNNIALAKSYYDSTIQLGLQIKRQPSSINAYEGLIKIALRENDYKKAYAYLEIKQQLNDSILNVKNLEIINNLSTLNNIKQKDAAITLLTESDLDNKKLIRQNHTITYLLCGLVAMLLLSFAVITNRLKLKRKLEKQLAINNERERIITDLHDDVGSTLSSMHIYSELAGSMIETKQAESKELMGKISQQGKDLSGRMSDIIWSLKPAGEGKYSLTSRLKNYSQELLAGKGIKTIFNINEELDNRIVNPSIRKNILLVSKEVMNNISKYSKAITATIELQQIDGFVILTIADDGVGFNMQAVTHGNGLNNIKQRSTLVKGSCTITSSPGNGTKVQCKFPLAIISHTA